MSIETVKRKLTNYFDHKDRLVILQAVEDVHTILVNASMLLRAFYLKNVFENDKIPDDHNAIIIDEDLIKICCDIVQGDSIKRERIVKQKVSSSPEEQKKFNDDADKKLRIKENNRIIFGRVLTVSNELPNIVYKSKLSISHILSYSVGTLLTAYENNIVSHFPKYVKKYIKCDLYVKYPNVFTSTTANNKIITNSKQLNYISKYITRKIVDDIDFPPNFPNYIEDIERYIPILLPRNNVVENNRMYDMKKHKWIYLQKMVYINKCLETNFESVPCKIRKLYNPLPFHSSNIPNHIRLDTSAVTQLLMTSERLQEFILCYKGKHHIDLKIKGKENMLSSFEKLTGIKNASLRLQAEFSSEFWTFFSPLPRPKDDNANAITQSKTNKRNKKKVLKAKTLAKSFKDFDQNRKNGKWRFDNALITDGYSGSFQIIKDELFGKKEMFKKDTDEEKMAKEEKKKLQEQINIEKLENKKLQEKLIEEQKSLGIYKKVKKEPKIPLIKKEKPVAEFPDLGDWTGWDEMFKVLSNDPGKHDILCLTDGAHSIAYTKKRRQLDTYEIKRRLIFEKMRRKVLLDNGSSLHDFESIKLSETSSKSCTYTKFIEYINTKLSITKVSKKLYTKPIFRQWRFLKHVKTKSSEAKFVTKIKKVFSPKNCKKRIGAENKKLEDRKSRWQHGLIHDKIIRNYNSDEKRLVIAWGNWGRNPNIKGCEPTPGIGIKRRFSKYFEIVTTPEDFTSQKCPCCGGKVENPIIGKKYIHPEGFKEYSKHHLLHCTNADCHSRWWNRNVLGSYNILMNFISNDKFIEHIGEIKTSLIREAPLY